MKKIKELTDEQKAAIPAFVQKWIDIGLSCEPLDLERAKRAVSAAYKAAGLSPPKEYIVCNSPIEAAIVAYRLKVSVGASVRNAVRGKLWSSVRASVSASVRASVWESVRESVRDSVWNSVGDSVWDPVWASVAASVRNSVDYSVRASVWNMLDGSHGAPLLAFYAYFRDVLHLDCVRPMDGLIELAQCCGWWAPYRNVAILQHRHNELHRDTEGRLHNESGMAVKYRDGWGLWALHGVTVDEQIILRPETQTLAQVVGEENSEIARHRIERWAGATADPIEGWRRYLRETSAKMIDSRRDDIRNETAELYRTNQGNVLICGYQPKQGGRKQYALRTPAKSCSEAQNWLSGGVNSRVVNFA